MSHLLTLACATLLATGPWRTYEVYEPEIERHFVVNTHAQDLKYNHDSTIAWFGDRWFCLWNANEPPAEGDPGQLNYVSTSPDGRQWTTPKPAFTSAECSVNPIPCPKGTQWQPNLIVVDDELWAVWSQNSKDEYHGCYISKLTDPDGKWKNERLLWDGNDRPLVDGKRWRLFPTQNPIRLKSGRVLAPITMMGSRAADAPPGLSNPWWAIEKRDSVLYTDDGHTWHVSSRAVQPKRTWAQWEPTVWQLHDGTVMMFARNNDHRARQEEGPRPAEMLLWSKSTDDGKTWTPHEYVPLETVASRMHVMPSGGDRFMMVHNDWPAGQFVSDRINLALFFTRGAGIDFVAGPGITGDELIVAYPQMWIHDGRLAVSYSQGRQYRSIKVAFVEPLPDPQHHYLFPRSNTPAGPAPKQKEGTLAFNGSQHLATRQTVELSNDAFSLDAWLRNQGNGTLFDNRSTSPAGGILWGISGGRPYVYLGTAEHNIRSSLALESSRWTYTGVSIDNRRGTATFVVDDKSETVPFTAPSPRPFQGTTAYIGQKRFESSKVAGFSGQIRRLRLYADQKLDSSQHTWLFNQCAEELGFRKAAPATAPKEHPSIDLNPAVKATLHAALDIPAQIESTTEIVTADQRKLLRISGNASAGVDLDHNDRTRGDRVQFEFRFQIEKGDRQVLVTTGDANHPARVVVDCGKVLLCANEEQLPLGTVSADGWSIIRLETGGKATIARLDDNESATIPHDPVGTWLYLGDGFPDRGTPPDNSLLIDMGSVRSRVTTNNP
jgi:BNR repeat protein